MFTLNVPEFRMYLFKREHKLITLYQITYWIGHENHRKSQLRVKCAVPDMNVWRWQSAHVIKNRLNEFNYIRSKAIQLNQFELGRFFWLHRN